MRRLAAGLVSVAGGGLLTLTLAMYPAFAFGTDAALIMGGKFSIMDYFIWNEIPTVVGNLVGGLSFTGLTLYATHVRTAPNRDVAMAPKRAAA